MASPWALLALALLCAAGPGGAINGTREGGAAVWADGELETVTFRPCSISVACIGNLGNQLVALIYGLHAARISRSRFEIDEFNCYRGLIGPTNGSASRELAQVDFSVGVGGATSSNSSSSSRERNTLVPVADPSTEWPAQCYGDESHHAFLRHPVVAPTIYQALSAAASLSSLLRVDEGDGLLNELIAKEGVLTIYLRGGDIFTKNVHPSYIQAPCVYYDQVIADLQPRKLVVVAADTSGPGANPCLAVILERHRVLAPIVYSAGVKDAYLALVHARDLVLSGVTSFGLTSTLVNRNLRRLVLPIFFFAQHDPQRPFQYVKSDLRWFLPRIMNQVQVLRYKVEGYPQTPKWTLRAAAAMLERFPTNIMAAWPREFDHPWSSQTTVLSCTARLSLAHVAEELRVFAARIDYMVVKRYPSASLLPGPVLVPTCLDAAALRMLANRTSLPHLPLYLVSFLPLPADHPVCAEGPDTSTPVDAFRDLHLGSMLRQSLRAFVGGDGDAQDDAFTSGSRDCHHTALEALVVDHARRHNSFNSTHLTWYRQRMRLISAKQAISAASKIMYTPLQRRPSAAAVYASLPFHIYQL